MSNISRTYIVGKVSKEQARNAVKRDHKASRKRMEPWKMNAIQRRNEVRLLAHYRSAAPGGRASGMGWAWVIGNYLRVLQGHITVQMLCAEVERLRLPPIASAIITQVVAEIGGKAWGSYRLYDPEVAGENLALTTSEREFLGIIKIDAVDEFREDRIRRLARERQAEGRAAAAAVLTPKPPTKAAMAKSLGVHRNTIAAWVKDGRLDPTTGELRDCALSVTASSHSPFFFEEDPVTQNAQCPDRAARTSTVDYPLLNRPHQHQQPFNAA